MKRKHVTKAAPKMDSLKCNLLNIRLKYVQIVIALVLLNPTNASQTKQTLAIKPHIILMVADDLGWNDLGFVNTAIRSPNIDKLIRDGIYLSNSYMLPLCTPSRSALLTGYYPYKTGMQHDVLSFTEPSGLPIIFQTLGDKFQQLGYATHVIGKWNLGFCNWAYTPLYRGFDSFLGYYQASEFYINHTTGEGNVWGYDFRRNNDVAWEYYDIHSSIPFVSRAIEIISKHDLSKPLFLYLPFQYVHNPNQVPQKYVNLYAKSPITNPFRRQFQGMVSAMDDDIGHIVKALKKYGLYENSVIGFTSDNGGHPKNGGNNYPLRGWKGTLFEGGTKVPAFFHSPLLKKKGYIYNGLMHATDWMPTLLSIGGGYPDCKIDGINQWPSIVANAPSPRTEMVYNIDNATGNMVGAIRNGPWKLTIGEPGNSSGWIPPEAVPGTYAYQLAEGPTANDIEDSKDVFLFNLEHDPTERVDLKLVYPNITNDLMERFYQHSQMSVRPVDRPDDRNGRPRYFNGTWSPGWCTAMLFPEKHTSFII